MVSEEDDLQLRGTRCFENGQRDFALGRSCNENPYKVPFDREKWFAGFMHQKRIVYRDYAKTNQARRGHQSPVSTDPDESV